MVFFDGHRLDTATGCLWLGSQRTVLRPRLAALLQFLAEHPNQFLCKTTLLQHVWDTTVDDRNLKSLIHELRSILGDDAHNPRFIETVRGGYRFVGHVHNHTQGLNEIEEPPVQVPPAPRHSPRPPLLVGRDAELVQLHQWLAKARGGEKRFGFVSGEPGIGKTTLVEAFLAQLAPLPDLRIVRGQ